MSNFSERMGIKRRKSIAQVESMDDDLRVALWNEMLKFYFQGAALTDMGAVRPTFELSALCRQIWAGIFNAPVDEMPTVWIAVVKQIKAYFFQASWAEAYDFVEFVSQRFTINDPVCNSKFRQACNQVLEREVSGYRFIREEIVPISSPLEVEAVESALSQPPSYATVSTHFDVAVRCLSDKQAPDYRNAIKEAISAVESMTAIIAGLDKPDLDKALAIIGNRYNLHGALRKSFSSLFGYASDAEGIRHALMEKESLTYDDAKFMVVFCATFVNYLRALTS